MSTLQSKSLTVYHLHTVVNMRIASMSALLFCCSLQPAHTGEALDLAAVKARNLQQQLLSME